MSTASRPLTPAEAIVHIRMAKQRGDMARARTIAQSARREHPQDAALADAAGDLAMKAGDPAEAERHFSAACSLHAVVPSSTVTNC